MLKYRLATAIIAIPLLLLAVFKLSLMGFFWLSTIVMLLAAYEWSLLAGLSARLSRIVFCLVFLLFCFCCAYFIEFNYIVLCLSLLCWLWLSAAVIAYNLQKSPLLFQTRWLRVIMGWFILSSGWLSLLVLKGSNLRGPYWLLYVLVLVWMIDSGAYFAGKYLGSSLLIPRVSPKKTWQGVWGGVVAALITITIGYYFLPGALLHPVVFIASSVLVIVFGIFGDLAISLLKRIAGVKDTGVLFPGHGGLLDRLDSILPAILLFACSAVLLHM